MKRMAIEGQGKNLSFLHAAFFLLFLGFFSGCGNKFWDPTQVGRFRPVPAVNVILDSLGVAEETPVAWEGAEEPLPIDTMVTKSDYTLRSGDLVSIAIFELLREGVYHTNNYLVTETGKISIPEVGIVQAAGLTETQLEEEIRKLLSPGNLDLLKKPSVTVALVNSEQRAFSILGDGVRFPSRYPIPRYDFRLADALATAGGASQFNVSYIYVSRSVGYEGRTPDAVNPGFGELELEVIEPGAAAPMLQRRQKLAPRAQYQWPRSKVVVASSEMITDGESPSLPSSFGQQNNLTPISAQPRGARNSSGLRTTRGTLRDHANVDEILEALSRRAVADSRANGQVNGQNSVNSRRPPVSRETRIDDRRRLEDAMNTPVSPTRTSAASTQNEAGNIEWVFRDGKWIPIPVGPTKPAEKEPTGHIEWVFQNGRWIPVQVESAEPTAPVIRVEPDQQLYAVPAPGVEAPATGFPQEGVKTRLIRIPADKLLAGDPKYNVVIKPGDSIFVPVDIVGECSIMGNVNRAGFINITGRPITLKQAIAAAGGLGPLAWPKRCEIIRRIGRKGEEIVMVDLDKIASGEQPDFFIKPHDLINVGTHATARWRAVLRNAFRATYGFGFVYDRNFANKDFFGQTFNPITPWKWDKVF
ncbi:MAG: hypothetical protein CEE38_08010 [Planctomycetes bacterium B3_Pla]|nr:MAG: hypothetical protein CEE38_08010 [Planctomycetes bacterium B3_Pla]